MVSCDELLRACVELWRTNNVYPSAPLASLRPALSPELRAMAHLREWLSPVQKDDLERFGFFYVRGSHTGTLYKITLLPSYNVIDEDGEQYCFIEPGVPLGDSLLTQKILLENDEEEALRVANVKSTWSRAAIVEQPQLARIDLDEL
jgi:hypothetical protein